MRAEPQVGQVIAEMDARNPGGASYKKIIGLDDHYAYCRSGSNGTGRQSRILRRRLATNRYTLARAVAW